MSPRAASAPAAEIMKGLATTADKIRALAHADCDRTEISKILGIRYQHVRNVMLRSDLSGGMQCKAEAECEPVEVDAVACPFTCPYLPIPTVLNAFRPPTVLQPLSDKPDYRVITGSGDPSLIRANCGCAAFRTRLLSRPCVMTLGTLRIAVRRVRIHSSPNARDAIVPSASQSLIWSMETVSTVTSFGIWIRTTR